MISATLITLNEEDKIEKVLKNLEDLVDEVIVVDSGSSDSTVKLARKHKAKVFYRKFDNFANQKNWAASKAKGKWILSVDADEEIPYQLKTEIRQSIKNTQYHAFFIPRRNFILGGEIKYSRWSPDKHIWLWKKDFGKWIGEVHEEVVVEGHVGELKTAKIHNSHQTVSEFVNSNNFYSTLYAQKLFKKNIKFSLARMFWNAFFEFNIRFLYKFGFMDGWRGFVLAYLISIYQLMVWIKLWELEQK